MKVVYRAASMMLMLYCALGCVMSAGWDGTRVGSVELKNFSFAVIADPHLGDPDHEKQIAMFTQRNRDYEQTIQEINTLKPLPHFILLNGDLVEHPTRENYTVFTRLTKGLKSLPILVHGNHDGRDGILFKEASQELNGTERLFYSYDCGGWHFVVLPSNVTPWEGVPMEAARWLDDDLKANKNKPVMVFLHYHLLPVGLSEPEFYTYPMDLKNQLLDTITKYGNVKYVFSGHVHSGIKPAIRGAWTYKGTNFIFLPTGVPTRAFGDEYPEYAGYADRGGYYIIVDVTGEKVTIRGRAIGSSKEIVFPSSFRQFDPKTDPRAFKTIPNLKANKTLANGGFEDDFNGWDMPHRYIAEENPGFISRPDAEHKYSGGKSAYLYCGSRGRHWAYDEFIERYQVVELPDGKSPVLKAAYKIDKPGPLGGGYIRISCYKRDSLQCLAMFKWGQQEDKVHRLPQVMAYNDTGKIAPLSYLVNLANEGKGLFYNLPETTDKWHTLEADIRSLYDKATGRNGAFDELQVDRLCIAFGVWAGRDKGSESSAYFDNFGISFTDTSAVSKIDGEILQADNPTTNCSYGKAYIKRVK